MDNSLLAVRDINHKYIVVDEIENIGDSLHTKRKNIFKQRDDQIEVITELTVNSGMRLVLCQDLVQVKMRNFSPF